MRLYQVLIHRRQSFKGFKSSGARDPNGTDQVPLQDMVLDPRCGSLLEERPESAPPRLMAPSLIWWSAMGATPNLRHRLFPFGQGNCTTSWIVFVKIQHEARAKLHDFPVSTRG